MTDFAFSPELEALRREVRAFVDDVVIPAEAAILSEDEKKDRTTLRAEPAQPAPGSSLRRRTAPTPCAETAAAPLGDMR